MNFCEVKKLGLISYEAAWKLQDELAAQIADGKRQQALLLLEHPHTYTFGRRGHAENLLWDEAELARRGVQVYWVDRGGDVTYHGPGQLVGYPLLQLTQTGMQIDPATGQPRLPQADYVGYVRRLEETLIRALSCLGVTACRASGQDGKPLTGVWIDPDVLAGCAGCPPRMKARPAKIAAIGVKVDARGVTRHGFALNINPDMTYWDGIIGCGLKDYSIISLAHLLDPVPSMDAVMQTIIASFGEVMGYEMQFSAD